MPSSISNSDALRPAHPLSFFDPEHVERPIPEQSWKKLAVCALLVAALLSLGWELYWRTKYYQAGDFKSTEAMWAEQRRKATGEATVVVGSSRTFFGLDLDVWEEAAGERPIQLSVEGTSPRGFLHDLAEDESVAGLVLVGVMVPTFFLDDGSKHQSTIDYRTEETVSERADHLLSVELEKVFAYIDEQTRPKRMIYLMSRLDPHKLYTMQRDRNAELWSRVMEDEAYREEAKAVWSETIRRNTPPQGVEAMSDDEIGAVIAAVKADVDKIRARGGEVAFLRFPYAGPWKQFEDGVFPRARFWDRLIRETNAVGVSFEDYPELQNYDLPEWSHLAPREAERYTRALVPILEARLEEAQP